MKAIIEMAARIADLERRMNSIVRHGTVAEVDPAKGAVRVQIGGTDDKPFLSPWLPYGQVAGALKVHSPPSVGQQMTVVSPTGDFRQAVAMPMTWSDKNASPSNKGDENVLTFGDAKIELRGGEIIVTVPRFLIRCGGTMFELTGNGIRAVASDYQFD
ncbi:MAG: phage baseplate assembly protein V [Brucella anthropi]